jgi:putative ABC transport system permease protein
VAEEGEYKWWEYWRRASMTPREVRAIESQVPDAATVTLCLTKNNITVKYHDMELSSITGYAVLNYFDKVQNIDIQLGRYLSTTELDGGNHSVVLGYAVYRNLFPGNLNPLGKSVSFLGRRFIVVGVMKLCCGIDHRRQLVQL